MHKKYLKNLKRIITDKKLIGVLASKLSNAIDEIEPGRKKVNRQKIKKQFLTKHY